MTTPITLRPLTPELRDTLLGFFEGPAFADNPAWRSCYCQFSYVDHAQVEWKSRTGEENRADAGARIACGRMQGVLAFRGDEVVGWCNAAPRTLLGLFANEPDPDAAHLGQITCFVVAPAHRRTGVARALLDGACDALRAQGMTLVEAHPSGDAATDAAHYHGPLSLYLSAGFAVVREEEDGSLVVRRALAP
jgi:ribosomal protein S18 acetylase RimI-like enzyme